MSHGAGGSAAAHRPDVAALKINGSATFEAQTARFLTILYLVLPKPTYGIHLDGRKIAFRRNDVRPKGGSL
jgi:hypothetical protein